MMTFSEMETAKRYGLKRLGALVFDNRAYGTIAKHQDLHFPNRRVGVHLGEIDYSSIARAFGWTYSEVSDSSSMAHAIEAIERGDGPMLVHVPISDEYLDPQGFSWRYTD
jgi:acetolactate synthase I/II/III large subunit